MIPELTARACRKEEGKGRRGIGEAPCCVGILFLFELCISQQHARRNGLLWTLELFTVCVELLAVLRFNMGMIDKAEGDVGTLNV